MSERKLAVGVLGALLAGVLVAVTAWAPDAGRLPEPDAGTNQAVGTDPTEGVPTAAVAATPTVALPESTVPERTVVATGMPAVSDALGGSTVVVRGVVSDPDQEPLANALVRAGQRSSTTTLADGSYELEVRTRRNRGRLWLIAEASGRVAATRQVTIDGDELTANFVLRPAVILDGRVVDTDGAGIAGARVWAPGKLQRSTETDADGHFRLDTLDGNARSEPGARHWIEASARGYVTKGELVSIEKADTEIVVIELSRGAVVRGVVYGPGQQPAPAASLAITTGKTKSRIEAASDAAGRFEFSAVPRGRHQLVVQHAELATATRPVVVPPPGQVLDLVIELQAGWTLRGIVRAADGGPIAGADVRADAAGGKGRSNELRSARTDEHGTFELRALPMADVRLSARAAGFVPVPWMAVDPGAPYREIVLDPAASIAGTIVDAWTGAPVTEFRIRMVRGGERDGDRKDGGGETLEFSSELGHWETADAPLTVGFTTDVEVSADGYAPTRAEGLTARLGASYDDHRIALSPGATLHGTVESGTGMPMGQTRLQVVVSGGRLTGRSDRTGRFSFDNVPHGEVRVLVEQTDGAVFVHRTSIPQGSREWQVTIRTTTQGELRGVVNDPDGRPAAGASLSLTAVDVPGLDGRDWREEADAAGRFAFRDLPFGVYRLARTASRGKPLETFARHITIAGRTPLEIRLIPNGVGTIRGTLVAPFPVPSGAYVNLVPLYPDDVPPADRSAPRWGRSEGNTFVFEGVEPGPYRLTAHCHDQAADEWMTGSAMAEVKESGETVIEVAVGR